MKKMKKIAISLLILCLGFVQLQAQRVMQRGKSKEKIESLRVAFITQKLNLSSTEAQQFWPIYNGYRADMKQLKLEAIEDNDVDQMTDKQAESYIMERFSVQERQLNLDKKYYAKFKEVIPVKKIAQLFNAENEFKRRLLKALKNRQGQMGGEE